MSLIKDMRRQRAVYWARSNTPDEFNQFGFADPVQIKCRWVDKNEQFLNSTATAIVSRSIVYTDRRVREGDWLRLGHLDTGEPADPRTADGAMEVKAFEALPDIDAKETLFRAIL